MPHGIASFELYLEAIVAKHKSSRLIATGQPTWFKLRNQAIRSEMEATSYLNASIVRTLSRDGIAVLRRVLQCRTAYEEICPSCVYESAKNR